MEIKGKDICVAGTICDRFPRRKMFSITIGSFTFYDVKIVDFSTIKKGDIITLEDFDESPNAVDATCETRRA